MAGLLFDLLAFAVQDESRPSRVPVPLVELRRYPPKRTGFDDLTDADLQAIVREINDTPMKVPGRETPNEVWYSELGKVMSRTSRPRTSVALTN